MNILQRLASFFGGKPGGSGGRQLPIYVLSRRCNEPIAGHVDLLNELSQAEEDNYTYYARKVLHTSGERRCFDQVEVQLWFDQNKQIAHSEVTGGRRLDAAEYAVELARFQAAPEAEEDAPHATAPQGSSDQAGSSDLADNDGKESERAQTDDGRQLEDEQDHRGSGQPGPGNP
jgi:hypothetical protein